MSTADGGRAAPEGLAGSAEPYWQGVWRRFRRHKLAMAGLVVLSILVLACWLGPWLSPYGFDDLDLEHTKEAFSLAHPLGTDELGQDTLVRLLTAGRTSLTVGLAAALVGVVIGASLGALAGFYGRLADGVVMRVADVMLAVPVLMLMMVLSTFLKANAFPGGQIGIIIFILGVTGWMTVSRLVRGEFLSIREQEYIEAARAQGMEDRRIILRHMLPNAMAPIFVATTLGVADAIMMESALSFLGFGIQPPVPTWGNMLTNAQQYMIDTPWLAVYPGLLIFLTIVSVNYVGDGLRDALDPKLKR
ncbi:MAG: oligopeptide ABC transporter permease [Candidatus Sericytochromatia bacterium]|nr:oligopeptide ABC transporter permease [Candidatus Sericytochromatia bacterium]